MRKQHLPLTKDQVRRGVYFSSQLVNTQNHDDDATVHEIMKDEPDEEKKRKMKLLLNDSFFDQYDEGLPPKWDVNIIRQ